MLGLVYIFALLWAGEALSSWLSLPLPGNVLGMVMMTLCLMGGVIKLRWVERAADTLVENMALFFVPPGVGIMMHFDLISSQWLPLSVSFVFSSFAVLAVVGWLQQLLEKKKG